MIWSKLGIINPEIVDVEDPLDREFASDYVQNVMALNPFPRLKILKTLIKMINN